MALSFSSITDLPTPPQRTDPDNFAARADAFVAALDDFVTEMNAVIAELNNITSGLDQQTAIAAYSSGTTYDFPDLVAGSDGHTYRCLDTGVLGQDPTTDDGTYWLRISDIVDRLYAHGNAGATLSLDATAYDTHTFTCDQSVLELSFSSMSIGRTITLIITNGGSSTITWPTTTKWPGGTDPNLATSGTDRVVIQRVASSEYHASVAGEAYA